MSCQHYQRLPAHGAAALPLDANLTGAPALQQEQKAGQYWSKALLHSLVDGYSQGLKHEMHIEELNSESARKQREWDLTADSLQVRAAVSSRKQLYSLRLDYIQCSGS